MTHDRRWLFVFGLALLLVGPVLAACGDDDDSGNATPQGASVASNLFISADIVQGSKNVPDDQKAVRSCTLQSRYPRNSEMVWRTRIVDPATGVMMDDTQIESAQVQLSNGTVVDLKYGAHPKNPPNEYYWTGSWVVPKDNPTGTLNYTIAVTAKDGRTGEFKPFSIAASLPAITEDVLPDKGE